MIAEIKRAARRRGITRLCHLTPFRNLVHIASGDGLLSTKQLDDHDRATFNKQDLERLDGHPDYISCSIEYPNAWYGRQRRGDTARAASLFPDWVCLTFEPKHLWVDTTLFCPRNAAAEGGRLIRGGVEAFESLYEASVQGSGNRFFTRNALPSACPTDEQAEVLVRRHVPLNDIQHVIVLDEAQARRTFLGLRQLGLSDDLFRFRICPGVFDPYRLSRLLRSGTRPAEVDWDRREMTGD
ncbi:MAG: DarT ssDNA thymidine ADP-ribosyltransferase family protein [Chloroflexota bacterium]|nr:DarT ssDNA thymidine ADP-ribosyltransferase family protein [Chloroflexota bacterium]